MIVTPLYAALLTTLYLLLSARVILLRRGRRIDLGDAGDRLAARLIRGHGNFAEYAPLGLLLLFILEQAGWPLWVLHGLGLLLLAGRIAHAWSFSVAELRIVSRTAGTALTLTMLGLAAILCLVQAFGG